MSKPASKKRSRSEWAQLMAGYEASSLPQRAFCDQQGVAYSSFCYWRKQLREPAPAGHKAAELIELSALASGEAPCWRVELDLGQGIVLRMR